MNTKKIKILPISDIHNNWGVFDYISTKLKGTFDILTISGDIFEGRILCPQNFIDLMEDFQKELDVPIVMIQGNHDFWSTDIFYDSKDIFVLNNSGIDLMGVSFWGSPYTPPFFNWANMSPDTPDHLGVIFTELLPDNIDVLLTHGGPYGYCDTVSQKTSYGDLTDEPLGSLELLKGVLIHKPMYNIVGHIHTAKRFEEIVYEGGTTKVYNVSCLDEYYNFSSGNKPSVIEIEIQG